MMFKRIHKWVALIVFVQLLIWLISGFLLGKLDHTLASGRTTFTLTPQAEKAKAQPAYNIQALLRRYPETTEVKLVYLLGKPLYQLVFQKTLHSYQAANDLLIDAKTGKIFILNAQSASEIAMLSYKEQATVSDVEYLEPPIEELTREQNPVWRVSLTDSLNTSIFVRAKDAKIITHVNDETRWRDLLLMLHFMDYAQTGSFNNVIIQFFALATLLLSGTGFWWSIRLIFDHQIRFSWFSKLQSFKVNILKVNEDKVISARKDSSILSALSDNDINIPSICGGGGVCGSCRFSTSEDVEVLPADRQHLNQSLLEEGYRLACQHSVEEISEINIYKSFAKKRRDIS
ncbi:2Fe-2S iron-sulfur cluster-binding protein [Aliiglaciecola litoralis]|uniref:2Fe-2S ferredoxin-type domain-containing protein n=1 Tax=Aliiglaciecola litoralis TaxID=582857 RepID=A0ABN1LBW9_9ALTE